MSLTAVSLFAGVGGFDLALQRSGVDVAAAVEIDPAARGVLTDRFPHTSLFNDVREVSGDALRSTGFVPERGILTGGFPCQDVSVAGRRAGLAGHRTGLFWEIVRILDESQATYVVLENVPGLLSSHGGRDMGTILGALGDLGYRWAYRVLDAQFFGVAQRRRRLFIVGHLGTLGRSPAEVLLEPARSAGNPAPSAAKGQSAARRSVVSTLQGGGRRGYRIDAEAAAGGHLIPAVPTPVAVPLLEVGARTGKSTTDPRAGIGIGADGDPMYTLQAGKQHGVGTPTAVRRITPTECERLQGFPDGWTATSDGKEQKDSARYRQLGNAVAVPVVEWIVRRIVTAEASTEMTAVA